MERDGDGGGVAFNDFVESIICDFTNSSQVDLVAEVESGAETNVLHIGVVFSTVNVVSVVVFLHHNHRDFRLVRVSENMRIILTFRN